MKVLKAVPDEDSPEPRLRALKAQRSPLLERIAGLAEARQRLDAAQNDERAATAAIGELDAVEIGAARKWASTGAVGAPPAPDLTRRSKLAADLSAAQAASAAMRVVAANVDAEISALRTEIAGVAAKIESVAIEVMELERVAAMKELDAVARQAARLIASIRAHVQFLGERGRHLRDSGHADAARSYFVTAERLSGLTLPDPQPQPGDVDMARLELQRRFGGLIE